MGKKLKKGDEGQIVTLFAIVLIALLGFLALAIDGGMIFSDRRYDQNASDAAGLAGGSEAAMAMENANVNYSNFSCDLTAITDAMSIAHVATIQRAASNNFTIENNLDNQHGALVECGVDDAGIKEKYIDVKVMISSNVKTAFAHLFFKGPIRNTVETVVRVHPRSTLAYGFAIASLSDQCGNDGGIEFDGNNDVTVNGGGIFSNSCITTNGGVSVTVKPSSEGIGFMDSFTQNGAAGAISPAPQTSSVALPGKIVQPPSCGSVPNQGSVSVHNNQDVTIEPGNYTQIKQTGGNLTMKPGLYCISGEMTSNGGSLSGNGVTIYLTGGDFAIGGGVEVNLAAPTGLEEDVAPAMPGMLMFMAKDHDGEIVMQGNTLSSYVGTIYAPDGDIEAGGTNSTMPTINTQLIGYRVKVHGNTAVEINFDTSENYLLPAYLDMYK